VRVGRFAPTPSGDLHIGSLVAAVASAADAKHHLGLHRIRIDDIDPPRVKAGSAERIVSALDHFMVPRDADVLQQSEHLSDYQQALRELIDLGVVFACNCSRKTLKDGVICTAMCRRHVLPSTPNVTQLLHRIHHRSALRLNLNHSAVNTLLRTHDVVTDRIQREQHINRAKLHSTPVLWRKDGYVSYLLATAVDDSNGITDVVRGADLWPETLMQQTLMRLLQRPLPQWAHVPCAVDSNDHKLGKQTRSPSIHQENPLPLLQKVWQFLGQTPFECGNLEQFWTGAADHWCISAVPQRTQQRI